VSTNTVQARPIDPMWRPSLGDVVDIVNAAGLPNPRFPGVWKVCAITPNKITVESPNGTRVKTTTAGLRQSSGVWEGQDRPIPNPGTLVRLTVQPPGRQVPIKGRVYVVIAVARDRASVSIAPIGGSDVGTSWSRVSPLTFDVVEVPESLH
jgi:hypothetical protein